MFDFPSPASEGQFYAPSGGPQYVYTNGAWRMTGAAPTSISAMVVTVWTASGTYTKPAGLRYLEIEGIGPGGGSPACAATTATQSSITGGGGAGGWGIKLMAATDVPASVAITIGAAGTAGAGGAGGNPGGDSSFGSVVTFGGGSGGNFTSANTGCVQAGGGTGGTTSGTFDNRCNGQSGGSGMTFPNANSTYPIPGMGGGTHFGRQPVQRFGTQPGIVGTGYGTGASGSSNYISQSTGVGAAGGPSMIKLTEYF